MRKIYFFVAILCTIMFFSSCSGDNPASRDASVAGLTATNLRGGTTQSGTTIICYEIFGFVVNQSSEAKEYIKVRVDWKNASGQVLLSDEVIVPKLVPGEKYPMWIYRGSDSDKEILKDFTQYTITFVSASKDLGRITTNFYFNDIQFYSVGSITRVSGKLVNNSPNKSKNMTIMAGSLSAKGDCVQYGIDILSGEILNPGQSTTFDFPLGIPIDTPVSTIFYCYGEIN